MKYPGEYRLGQYQITVDDYDQLQWETHHAFGMRQRGTCFIHGDILLLGRMRQTDDGYLALEFFQKLEKLPPWEKTSYYCFLSELLRVDTGRSLSENVPSNKFSAPGIETLTMTTTKELKPGLFRLAQYQIAVNDSGEISWQASGGINFQMGGKCAIESGILFIGPPENKDMVSDKRIFMNKLYRLPPWDGTMVWCRHNVLRSCLRHAPEKAASAPRSNKRLATRSTPVFQDRNKRALQGEAGSFWLMLIPFLETVKMKWQGYFRTNKLWHHPYKYREYAWGKYLILLLIISFAAIGLILMLHSFEDIFHQHHPFREHGRHHKGH